MDNQKNYNEITDLGIKRSHLVLLGSGASFAAFPRGDKNGNKLPLMDNLVEVLEIGCLFEKYDISYKCVNFEKLYSEIHKIQNSRLLSEIELKVYQYFSKLELPETPTIYDHLVTSLRSKDVIATFNWDPFLFDACKRNYKKMELPKIFFLHGNVRIGYCIEHNIKGLNGTQCSECGKLLKKSKLLFPIEEKNYNDDVFIKAEWDAIRNYMKRAYVFTVFGYGAPKSDIEAISLLKEGWGNVEDRNFEEVEIIDIKEEKELRNLWNPFIHTHHYKVHKDFYDSIIANHPRRSCEAIWKMLMEVEYIEEYKIPMNVNFDNLLEWLKPRIEYESTKG